MNKELIKKYKDEFDHWLNGGKLYAKFVNDPWEEAPEDVFSYSTINFILAIDDEYAEFRRALAEGKIVEAVIGYSGTDGNIWESIENDKFHLYDIDEIRIKPDVPKFKVGDWVIHNGEYKRVTKAVDGLIDCLDNKVAVIMKEESLELWEPQDKEYFWYKNDLVKFDDTKTNCGTLLESVRGCSYHTAETNYKEYCEPFVGQLPTNIREYKKG